MPDSDTLQRFLFENSNVRGSFVHLGASFQTVQQRYAYPAIIAEQLGQALASSVLLGATIKFDGAMIMQIQSSGFINLLVTQCDHEHRIRGLARWQDDVSAGDNIFGDGNMTITLDATNKEERYQGIVSLEEGSLGNTIEAYFKQSEQLQTRLWLAADGDQAVGLLLQHLPGDEPDPDIWGRIETLGATISNDELLNLTTEDILHRLFHEEDVRLFDPEPVSFHCSCSHDKIVTLLRGLGIKECRSIIEEQEKISVGCEFCNQHYEFDTVDVEEVFASATPSPGSNDKN